MLWDAGKTNVEIFFNFSADLTATSAASFDLDLVDKDDDDLVAEDAKDFFEEDLEDGVAGELGVIASVKWQQARDNHESVIRVI